MYIGLFNFYKIVVAFLKNPFHSRKSLFIETIKRSMEKFSKDNYGENLRVKLVHTIVLNKNF